MPYVNKKERYLGKKKGDTTFIFRLCVEGEPVLSR